MSAEGVDQVPLDGMQVFRLEEGKGSTWLHTLFSDVLLVKKADWMEVLCLRTVLSAGPSEVWSCCEDSPTVQGSHLEWQLLVSDSMTALYLARELQPCVWSCATRGQVFQ